MACFIVIEKGQNRGKLCKDVHKYCTSYRHNRKRVERPLKVNIRLRYEKSVARLKSMIKVIIR